MRLIKLCFGIQLLFLNAKVFSQDFNYISISLRRDTINSYVDAKLLVTLTRSDSSYFLVPDKIIFGSVFDTSPDLFIEVEKEDSKHVFSEYVCKYSIIPMPGFQSKKINYVTNTKVLLETDLDCLECIDQGKYRMRVAYNKKANDGYINPPNITVRSIWVYFFVSADEIILSEYRRSRQ